MKHVEIDELAYILKQAKDNNQPKPIFFLGAGASKSGNIPLANDIVKDILNKYSDAPAIKKLKEDEKSYPRLMKCLLPSERDNLLKGYIDNAKINVTHIYLAQLLSHNFIDYVLTVNFDNLMLRALSLFNEFPSTYDMAILKDLTTTTFKEMSVVYLHGQHHGLWLLNTDEEMEKVKATVPRIFDSIKNKRTWVFIGYSGNDPIFEHIKQLGRFDNGLFWVTHKDEEPNAKVKTFLNTPNTNAYVVKGYDSDAFMLKLNTELGLDQPQIINQPFSSIKEMLDNIVDIDDEKHFKGVKERLEIAKEQVNESIKLFEKGEFPANGLIEETYKIDSLKKAIIDLLINEEYKENIITAIETETKQFNNEELNSLLAGLYSDWGVDLGDLAKIKEKKEAEELYQQAFEKYKKATEIKADKHEAFNNWGTHLCDLAKIKEKKEAEELYQQAFEKYKKAIEIKPDYHKAFYNWGTLLSDLAKMKEGKEAEDLYQQAFEKYKKAIKIQPNYHQAFNNWGNGLSDLAKMKEGQEVERLYNSAFEKLQKATEYGGESYNLACLYAIRSDKENALNYLNISLSKKEIDTDFVLNDKDWEAFLDDKAFQIIIAKAKESENK